MLNKKMIVIGGGNMGHSLVRGILKADLTTPGNLMVVDVLEEKLKDLQAEYGVHIGSDPLPRVGDAEIIILAVKPLTLNSVIDRIIKALFNHLLNLIHRPPIGTPYPVKQTRNRQR